MRTILNRAQAPDGVVLALLSGTYSEPEDFVREGFPEAVRAHGIGAWPRRSRPSACARSRAATTGMHGARCGGSFSTARHWCDERRARPGRNAAALAPDARDRGLHRAALPGGREHARRARDVALGARGARGQPSRPRDRGNGAAQHASRTQRDAPSPGRRAARRARDHFRRRSRSRSDAARARPARRAGRARDLLLHRRAGVAPPRAGTRDPAARPRGGKPFARPPDDVRNARAAGPAARDHGRAGGAQAPHRPRATLLPPARGTAQSPPRSGAARAWAAAGDVDATRLRHTRLRCGCGRREAHERACSGRHPAAPRRPRCAHRRRRAGGSRSPAAHRGRGAIARPQAGHPRPSHRFVTDAFFRGLAKAAALRYEARDRFARHFAFGKLTRDPVFRYLLVRGLFPRDARILDLGCGQGLLAALLAQARVQENWPGNWAPAANPVAYRGIDSSRRDIERAAHAGVDASTFTCSDIRSPNFGSAEAVVILDVLHYVDPAEQEDVLRRGRAALGRGGGLVT